MKLAEFFSTVRSQSGATDSDQVLASKLGAVVNTTKKTFNDADVKRAVEHLSSDSKGVSSDSKALPSGKRGGEVSTSQSTAPTQNPSDGNHTQSDTDYGDLVSRALEAMESETDLIDDALAEEQAVAGYNSGQQLATIRSLSQIRGMRDGYKTHAIASLRSLRQNQDRVAGYTQNASGLTDSQEYEQLQTQLGKRQ